MIEIRQATVDDAASILEININSWQDTYKGIFPDAFLDSLTKNLDEGIEKCKNKINEYIVAKVDNEIVGFARIGKNKKDYSDEYGEIYALYVDNNYKGKGIGTKLVKYCFSELEKQYKYCLISTLEQNPANEFYKKIGGKHIGVCDFKLLDNIYKENIYLYEFDK